MLGGTMFECAILSKYTDKQASCRIETCAELLVRILMQIYKGHHGPIWGVQFAHHGETFATASEDGTIRIWDSGPDASRE